MPQVLVRPEDVRGDRFFVRGAEAGHVARVLRKKEGDVVRLFDGQGRRFMGRLARVDAGGDLVEGVVTERLPESARPRTLVLFQGLPRGSKFDYVVEKATELGVDAIVPFLSRKNPIRLSEPDGLRKIERWSHVAEAAAKQCGRPDVPEIEAPRPLESLSERLSGGDAFVLWESGAGAGFRDVFQRKGALNKLVNLIVGPEAGFEPGEIEWLRGRGAEPVHLGSRILRSETAGLVGLSILNHELDLF